jgi:hypothetical protein
VASAPTLFATVLAEFLESGVNQNVAAAKLKIPSLGVLIAPLHVVYRPRIRFFLGFLSVNGAWADVFRRL